MLFKIIGQIFTYGYLNFIFNILSMMALIVKRNYKKEYNLRVNENLLLEFGKKLLKIL